MPKILVIGTRSYEFEDERGNLIKGSKAYSFGREEGELVPVKVSFRNVHTAKEFFPKAGIYEVELGFRGSVECAVLEKEIDLGL
jgi:hypothetical protein